MGKIYRKLGEKQKPRQSRKRARLKDIIAGVFSPNTAASKLQGLARSRTVRQSVKKDKLLSTFSLGAAKYKSAIQKQDFRGIDMSRQTLSRRVLDNANFEKVKFTFAKLNGCKMKSINAKGADFSRAEMKKSQADGADFTGAKFESTNMLGLTSKKGIFKDANFKYSILSDTILEDCNLENAVFDCVISNNKTQIKNCNINGLTIQTNYIHNNPGLSTFIHEILNNNKQKTIEGLKILNEYTEEVPKISIRKILVESSEFRKLLIDNFLFRENCAFSWGIFNDSVFDKIQIHAGNISYCKFVNTEFKQFIGHSTTYRTTLFHNCKFINADLRQTIFLGCDFKDCDLTGAKFSRTNLTDTKFRNCILRNINFQECQGMENRDFRGVDLQGSRLVGINLRGSDFREANLRGVQFDFSEIHGSDFTGADLQNANVGVAEGRYETVGIPDDLQEVAAVDTHKTFYNIDINRFIVFLNNALKNGGADTISSQEALRERMKKSLANILREFDLPHDEKEVLVNGLITCFKDRLDSYNFAGVIAGTEPRKTFMDLLIPTIQYLDEQSKEFRELYAQALILDSINAHGQGGLSCAAGIIERFVTVLKQSAAVIKDSEPGKADEYNELINIIDNNPALLIKQYQQEWFEFHKEGGPNAFAEDESLDVIMESYERFLREKFAVDSMSDGTKKTRILKIIEEHEEAGTRITREYIENMVLFFGGGRGSSAFRTRSKRANRGNIFTRLRERFYLTPTDKLSSSSRVAGKAKATGKANANAKTRRQELRKRIRRIRTQKIRGIQHRMGLKKR